MKLSIIIPVIDEENALREQAEALQPLLQAGHEVIIVDGGSRDDSLAAARAFASRVLLARPGRARQMNAGAADARGDVLLFLHVDTRLPDGAAGLIEQGMRSGCVRWGRFDVELTGRAALLRLVARMMNLRSRLSSVCTGDQALFVRRSVFEQVGGFADVPLMEDVALSKVLRRQGRPLALRERVISSSRRWEQHGVIKTIVLMWWLRLLYVLGVAPQTLHRLYYRSRQPGHRPDSQAENAMQLLVFAKVPVSGQVKTRLQPVLGEQGALQLHKALIRLLWERLARIAEFNARLWVSGQGGEAFFQKLHPSPRIHVQQGDDLGQRMAHAASVSLQQVPMVIIVGADCPSVDPRYVQQAWHVLQSGVPVVLGPANDGGYVLVGVRERVPSALFSDIPWGSVNVLAVTRQRLQTAGITWHELENRWDVDTLDDLPALQALTGLKFRE